MTASSDPSRRVRIGCGAGFWGDSAAAPAQLVRRGGIDFLVLDYLAEITMSILARMRQKKPDTGYATAFVDAVMAPLAKEIAARRIKVVANAGGVNPRGCRDALVRALARQGVELEIAVVVGDDITDRVAGLRERGVTDLEGGRPLPEAPVSANVYLGAEPIAEALREGADVVITGRCVDSALTLGPLLATFGWSLSDLDRLAMGSLAGHVVECGAQATGGIFTDWHLVEQGWSDMGFPIVECAEDGSFVVTKPEGTGGLVSKATVGEQIVYEVHDPGRYVLPDVVCDLRDVRLEQEGPDRVRVSGARGLPPPADYKASLTVADGHRVGATLAVVGHEAPAKARRVGEAILERTRRLLAERGAPGFRETSVEVIGAEEVFGANARAGAVREVLLKVAASHDDERALELLAREIAPAGTAMAPSISGFAGGRPRVQPIVRLVSCLVPKSEVEVSIEIDGRARALPRAEAPARSEIANGRAEPSSPRAVTSSLASSIVRGPTVEVPLWRIAHARSGDKGNTSNIGVLARSPDLVSILREQVTATVVKAWFSHLVRGEVHRYEWPGLDAFNFVMTEALGGGGIASLRFDPQGKQLAQILLELPVRVPA